MPEHRDPTTALFDAARGYVAAYHQGHRAARVIVLLEDGSKAFDGVIPACQGIAAAAAGPKLTEGDRTVLEAVAELGESPTGQEIAKQAGYPYDAHLKMRLALLRRKGFLGGEKGEKGGYPLTDAACEALADGA